MHGEVRRLNEVKDVIERFGAGPGGKHYYSEFKDDLKKMQLSEVEGSKDISFAVIEENVDQIIEAHAFLK